MRYTQVFDGEWIRPMPARGHRLACCDCAAVHRMDFRVRRGHVEFRAFRDDTATRRRRARLKLAAPKEREAGR